MAQQTARVVLDVTYDNEVTEHPENWNWHDLLATEPSESVVLVEVITDQHGADYPWAVTDRDGSILDRFATEQEARDALDEGGYPDDAEVAFVNSTPNFRFGE